MLETFIQQLMQADAEIHNWSTELSSQNLVEEWEK